MKMPKCKVCTHPKQSEIDSLIMVDGATKDIARRFAVSIQSLARHRRHYTLKLAQSATPKLLKKIDVDDIVTKVDAAEREAQSMMQDARQAGDIRTALTAIDTLKSLWKFLADIKGWMNKAQQPVTNNTLNVYIDEATARRIAKDYLERHPQPPQLPGGNNE
jgi:hypothetical protein